MLLKRNFGENIGCLFAWEKYPVKLINRDIIIVLMAMYEDYTCESCKYKFKMKPGELRNFCPYCGRKGSFQRDVTAEELLEDI